MRSHFLATLVAFLLASQLALAQSNQIPGTDVSLGSLDVGTDMQYWGRVGAFPVGTNGFSISTTSCNLGSVNVPWLAPMQENHPFIAFLGARVSADGSRIEQISDRSFVKHGFFALSNSQCTPCQQPSGGTFLGVGCSDTYSTGNNGDRFYLGPPDEIDPWLGTWSRFCSYFDRGDPAVAPPADCDGNRSLSSTQISAFSAIKNRIQIADADLGIAGAKYYYQGHYIVRGEPEAARGNNLGTREFRANWGGATWVVDTTSYANPFVAGSVLSRWPGASVSSATNAGDDGRIYVAVRVTGPSGGFYRYEYAVHNRDNLRGVGQFRIPVAPCATIANEGFGDIDGNAGNDWSFARTAPDEISFSTGANPLLWNTIFNFWFESDAAPNAATLSLDAFSPGPGSSTIALSNTAPVDLVSIATYGVSLPNSTGLPALISFSGSASIGLNDLVLECSNLPPNIPGLFFYGTQKIDPGIPFGNGLKLVGGSIQRLGVIFSDASGFASRPVDFTAPPTSSLMPGDVRYFQFWYRNPSAGGAGFNTSDGLEVHLCN